AQETIKRLNALGKKKFINHFKKYRLMKRYYVGVYGIYKKDNNILFIKKSRGPYKDMYDLPGGSIEKDESVEDALKREFIEEAGLNIKKYTFLTCNEYSSSYLNSKNQLIEFHHQGTYFLIEKASGSIKTHEDGHDSLGSEWIPISEIKNKRIAPIVK